MMYSQDKYANRKWSLLICTGLLLAMLNTFSMMEERFIQPILTKGYELNFAVEAIKELICLYL